MALPTHQRRDIKQSVKGIKMKLTTKEQYLQAIAAGKEEQEQRRNSFIYRWKQRLYMKHGWFSKQANQRMAYYKKKYPLIYE